MKTAFLGMAVGLALTGTPASPAAVTPAAVTPATGTPAAGADSVVLTSHGAVRGTVGARVRSFQGIPYAEAERWAAPRPAAAWTGVREATAPGKPCAQPERPPIGVASQAEDCLVLNVTTPASRSGELPVIVWIHGGSLMYGTGDMYGPDRLAAAGAVVVSMNYRLGVMSFLTHPSLPESGSLAVQDQQAALRWVRANIAAFGGDARNVTIMGESGGGFAVCGHLASPKSAGLFDRAIIQSAPCATGGSRTRAEAEADSARTIEKAGCADAVDVAACLRKVPVSTLLAAYAGKEPSPISGTTLLPLPPGEALRTGRFNRVPVLIGVNHDEENGMVIGQELFTGKPLSAAEYAPAVRRQFGSDADAVLRRYPLDRGPAGLSPGQALARVKTDAVWSVPTLNTARALSRWTPTRMYEFAERDTPWFAGYPVPSFPAHAQHMAELPYLFDLAMFGTPSRKQAALGERMIAAWVRFAATGDPHGAGETAWPRLRDTGHAGWHVHSLTSGAWKRARFTADHDYRFWNAL
ncbi:carboxylesterase/lipase family protein [Nonomuraea dietziae]|uniref:Carboxylic ester hydrolase n=1 Tax=Nonomuraea dietziae TaxID=65515 RepID=A0A7W5VBF7_9ACTN|nr:carboxylesterase family protein [Nonomuraea dietziae]MBB3728745.1 para-nitrobenzyl esterase [Nonomuraea dietziae]